MNRSFNRKPERVGDPNKPEFVKLERGKARGILMRLMRYVLAHPILFVTAIVFTLLSNQLALLGPEYSGVAVDAIAAEGGPDFNSVYENISKMIF